MRKILLSFLLIFTNIFSKSVRLIKKNSSVNSKSPNFTDFKSRFTKSEQELQSAKANLLKELNSISKIDINYYIKMNRDFFKKQYALVIDEHKKNDKCSNFVTKCKEINQQLKKHKNIKILVTNNLFIKYGSPGLTYDKTIFLDSHYVNNQGIIMHEICHAINDDCILCYAIENLKSYYLKKASPGFKKISELYRKFSQKLEKRADLWSASHGKNFAKNLIVFFEECKKSHFIECTENHPPAKERISYLK
jgi:hypothetical protein